MLINFISKIAIIKKRNKIESKYFQLVVDNLYEHINKNTFNRRIAIDGSKINLLRCNKKDYKESRNKNYTTALISSVYDVDKLVPINYKISNSFSERGLLKEQLKYFKKGDIGIMDRGYYSKEMVNMFQSNGCHFIIRLAKTNLYSKQIKSGNQNDILVDHFNGSKQKLRLINFKNNKDDYFLLTDLIGPKYSFSYLRESYKMRWLRKNF